MKDTEKASKEEYTVVANTMLKLLNTGNITLEEYLERCSYWAIENLDDLYFRSLPSKPVEVFEYEQLSNYKRQKLTQEFFIDNPGIFRYYRDQEKIILENFTNLSRLKIYKKHIPESDIENHEKLDKKIMDFKMKMEGYEN